MKKLVGISLIALLAVGPLAANAAVGDVVASSVEPAHADPATVATNNPGYALVTEGANDSNVATAGYVKGAYNAAMKAINKVATTAGNAADQDLSNISATGEGVIKALAAGGAYDNTDSGLSATTIQDAIDEVATTAANALTASDIAEGSTNGTISVDGTDVDVHGLGSAAFVNTGDLADTAGTYDNTGSGLTATTIQDAIDELADNAGDYATQTAVENTIETATITATVPTLTTWGNDASTGTVGVNVSSIAATYAEPTNP